MPKVKKKGSTSHAKMNQTAADRLCGIPWCKQPSHVQVDGGLFCRDHGDPQSIANARAQARLVPRLLRVIRQRSKGTPVNRLTGVHPNSPLHRFTVWAFLKPIRRASVLSCEEFERLWKAGQYEEAVRQMVTTDTQKQVEVLIASGVHAAEDTRETTRPANGLTVPQRLAAVMKDKTMSAGEVKEALAAAGDPLMSGNLQSYISTILNASTMSVLGPDGKTKVRCFRSVSRGYYRVATDKDIADECRTRLEGRGIKNSKLPPPVMPNAAARATPRGDSSVMGELVKQEWFLAAVRGVVGEELNTAPFRRSVREVVKEELSAILRTGLIG